jgi:hypothetical protein
MKKVRILQVPPIRFGLVLGLINGRMIVAPILLFTLGAAATAADRHRAQAPRHPVALRRRGRAVHAVHPCFRVLPPWSTNGRIIIQRRLSTSTSPATPMT